VNTSFSNKKIHFIGIGGISLSALAKLMVHYGATVSGSDAVQSERLDELKEMGIQVWVGSHPEFVDADFVVFTSALNSNDAELRFAINSGVPVFERHEFLGVVSQNFGKVIAIAGTHGKTTTTAMLTAIFSVAKKKFTAHIGGDVIGYSNLVVQGDEYFITEACEFRRSFLSLRPDIAVVLNIESDHPDCFHNEKELFTAFESFVSNVKENGSVVVRQGFEEICKSEHTITFSNKNSTTRECTYQAVRRDGLTSTGNEFDVYEKGELICAIQLKHQGDHNIQNAIAAFSVARECGIAVNDIKFALENFQGVKRRFEEMGSVKGAKIIFDYAHHPSEIRASISVARKQYPRLAVLFQPHTYSRTRSLLPAFVTCFSDADLLAVLPTYAAREKESDGVGASKLFLELLCGHEKSAVTSRYNLLNGLEDGAQFIKKMAIDYDCFLMLGAGDIIDISNMLNYDKIVN